MGGAIVQNAGAYGQEIADVIVNVRAWDRTTRQVVAFEHAQCGFGYRTSMFKHDPSQRYAITGATLQLAQTPTATPRYGDVTELLQERKGTGPYTLNDIRSAVLEVRSGKGMILGASLPRPVLSSPTRS